MESLRSTIIWLLSAAVSFAGARLWVKVLMKADPTWKAKEHRWGQYIFAGVLSIFLALVFYFILGLIWWPMFYSFYPAADDFWYAILVNGPAEEWAKFLVFWAVATGLGKVKEPRDGVLVAMMVALGFSFWENIRYLIIFGPGSIPARLLWASSGHMAFASVWGYFGGQVILEPPDGKGIRKYRYVIASVFTMSFIHGMFNFLIRWVGSGAGLILDFMVYIVTLILLAEVLRVPSAYRQFPIREASTAIPIIRDAMKRDPNNALLQRRLGFYHLALGQEKEAFRAWMLIPAVKRDAYINAWITVLTSRRGHYTGVTYRDRNNELEKHLVKMSRKSRELLRKRLDFYLKGEARPWLRRIDWYERNGVRFSNESIWS